MTRPPLPYGEPGKHAVSYTPPKKPSTPLPSLDRKATPSSLTRDDGIPTASFPIQTGNTSPLEVTKRVKSLPRRQHTMRDNILTGLSILIYLMAGVCGIMFIAMLFG